MLDTVVFLCSVVLDTVVFLVITLLDKPLPSWTYPFIFYIQVYKPLHTHMHIIILQSVTIATLIVIILIINNYLVLCVMINSCFCISLDKFYNFFLSCFSSWLQFLVSTFQTHL